MGVAKIRVKSSKLGEDGIWTRFKCNDKSEMGVNLRSVNGLIWAYCLRVNTYDAASRSNLDLSFHSMRGGWGYSVHS